MKTYAVFYEVSGEIKTATVTCFQAGEAYNWTVEDVSKEYGCKPGDVKIHTVIEVR